MKIALLSRGNTACGVSLHAELIGREWIKMGHSLSVFAPNNIRPVKEDEDYVIRCYSDEGDHKKTFFHPESFLDTDYDILVAERVERVPLEPLREIFPEIRKKAKTVYVVHERKLPTNPMFYDLEWDAIVCFDERYKRQLSNFEDKIHIIPYPAGYLRRGNKQEARKKLGLPPNAKIIFGYGWAPELHVFPILPSLQELCKHLSFVYLVLADPTTKEIEKLRNYEFMELRQELPPMDRIVTYLHASDIYLVHKQKKEVREGAAVVPSAILMCIGASTPIVTSDTEFVWFLDKEVIKYSNPAEFEREIAGILTGEMDIGKTLKAASLRAARGTLATLVRVDEMPMRPYEEER
ncbi:MAG: hypothetical protein KAU16_07220 [Methanophagales archaeon]|nr:hypothetical protein [Methanophagales archaeon]